jgi:AcrR family transcriptional regulator
VGSTPSLAEQVQSKRTEMMISEIERVALTLFEEKGFSKVTVEEIANEAQISERTFFRYFRSKENLFQVRIDHRSAALSEALAARPADEALLESVRAAMVEVLAAEDIDLVRRWAGVVTSNTDVLQGVLGGIHMKVEGVLAEFLAERLQAPADSLVVVVLAAAIGGVLQVAGRHWFFDGGDLYAAISEGIDILEHIDTVAAADRARPL